MPLASHLHHLLLWTQVNNTDWCICLTCGFILALLQCRKKHRINKPKGLSFVKFRVEHFQVWVLAAAPCKLFFPCPSNLSLHLDSDSPAIRSSLRKWLIQKPAYRKTLLLSLYLFEGTDARAPSSISLQGGDQVMWSVLRSSKILCGTGCGLVRLKSSVWSKTMYLTSIGVRKCDSSSSSEMK